MPAGCDFFCKNEKCKNHKTGLVLTAPWPIGNIGLVINCSDVKKQESFRQGLIKLKEDGRKYACLRLPNTDDIPVLGYRFNTWCPTCYIMWQTDMLFDDNNKTLEDLFKVSIVPTKCPKCEGEIWDFEMATNKGILCLECKQELAQSRWFSNERTKE